MLMRLFVGCFVAPEAAARLHSRCPAIPGVRWIAPTNYHVTLHFIGEAEMSSVPGLMRSVADLAGLPTQATVEKFGGFPTDNRARVVVAQLQVDPLLFAWCDQLRSALSSTNGRKAFAPHVTVARSRTGIAVPLQPTAGNFNLPLGEPALYRSRTLAEGARYEPVAATD